MAAVDIHVALKSIFPVETVVLGGVISIALVALVLWWHSWRSGRALCFLMPRAYRIRDRQDLTWRRDFGEAMPQVDKVLIVVCECFLFNPEHRYQLSPDDEILEIYRRCRLPRWLRWLDNDAGEIDSLLERLGNGFDRSHWYKQITIGEIVKIMQRT